MTSSPEVPLIPRAALYGNPERAGAQISRDGRYLSWLAPVDGVLNIWIAPFDQPDAAHPITGDRQRGIRTHEWAYTNEHIIYPQDSGGDEDFHVYAIDVQTKQTIDLTPFEHVAAGLAATSPDFPGEVLVNVNNRVPELHDVHRVDIRTGERSIVLENPGFAEIICRDDFTVPLAMVMTEDGGSLVLKANHQGEFEPFIGVEMEDSLTTHPVGFTKDGNSVYMLDSRGRDKGALTLVDLADPTSHELIFESDLADVDAVMIHPTEKNIQAVAVNHLRSEWTALDEGVSADLAHLATVAGGEILVISRTLDDSQWLVAFFTDDGPVRYYLYSRADREARFLFTDRPEIEQFQLTKQHPVVVTSRDGLELVCYLFLPVGAAPDGGTTPAEPLPMVLAVHGGPWARDSWGLDPELQLLANRGYAVMTVNYRGSTGFGKSFLNAGNHEWSAKMHDDLLDAVEWAVEQGIADPARVAIHGGSYGGYATLVGLTFTPEVFACGVDIVGPSNLITLLESIPAYWAPMLQLFKDRVGDPTTDEGRAFLTECSPISRVDQIQRPLLIGQGKNDPRVKEAESEQIVHGMERHGIPVTYVLFPDEGHGFVEPANRLSFFAVSEAFLAAHLGGRAEPFGEVFEGSSITIPEGAEGIPGMPDGVPR